VELQAQRTPCGSGTEEEIEGENLMESGWAKMGPALLVDYDGG